MIQPSEQLNGCLVRLLNNPDFKAYMAWLDEEQTEVTATLRRATETVKVHQLQGQSQVLEDIRQSVMAAPTAAAAKARARNT